MITDWKAEIAKAWLIKQAAMEIDKNKLWEYHLPELAATETQFIEVEKHLGQPLDPRFKEFLKCANGWRAFYQTVDLFGTHDLIGGNRKETGNHMLSFVEETVLRPEGVVRSELLPIAATSEDRDIFLMIRAPSVKQGQVLWIAGEVVERFPRFDDYFLAMMDYNRVELERLQKQNKNHK